MGFYGNITDKARTHFQFDAIYPSRVAMDSVAASDDIMIGRFVLVNYEDTSDNQDFETHFNDDISAYGNSRGYDSTVWQKVFSNGESRYIMIAELNTMTPIFDISTADAPRMIPMIPHFGADSTNIYYKLHWSPTWGFRVKAANPNLEGPILNDDGSDISSTYMTEMSSDETEYHSDEETRWFKTVYNKDTDTTSEYIFGVNQQNAAQGMWTPVGSTLSSAGVPAAIYYNKDGFNPRTVSYGYDVINDPQNSEDTFEYAPNTYYRRVDDKYILAEEITPLPNTIYYKKIENHITIEPTGYSGHTYNMHENETSAIQPDTQELSIMLPEIGNAIAAVWDLIYGGEDLNEGKQRNLDISWESAKYQINRDGLRLVTDFQFDNVIEQDDKYLYKTKNVDTVAGALNSVHDLMGMIIIEDNNTNLLNEIDTLDENRIYYDTDNHTFNRKRLFYNDTAIGDTDTDIYDFEVIDNDVVNINYQPNKYFISNGLGGFELDDRENFVGNETYYLRILKEENEYEPIAASQFTVFDPSTYAYQDYFGKTGYFDYIRQGKYFDDKTYYYWDRTNESETENKKSVVYAMEGCEVSDNYEPGKYYLYEGGDYIKDYSLTPQNKQYYTFNANNCKTLRELNPTAQKVGVYMAGLYAYADGNNYVIDYRPTMTTDPPLAYYGFTPDQDQSTQQETFYREVISYVEFPGGGETMPENLYKKNFYYIYPTQGQQTPEIANGEYSDYINSETTTIFYIKRVTYEKISQETQRFTINPTRYTLYQFYDNTFFVKDGDNFKVVVSAEQINGKDPTQIYVLRSRENSAGTFTLSEEDKINGTYSAMKVVPDKFYTPNKYYYLTTNEEYSSFLLDVANIWHADRDYYTFDSTKLGSAVNLPLIFEPYKYYQKIGEEYKLITTDTIPQGVTTVYKHNEPYYIKEDRANVLAPGAKWNFGVTYIPSSVTLATRTEEYGLEPIQGFARNLGTMHGLILKIKALLDDENIESRDIRTVRGALNALNDKISQLSTVESGQFIIVDDYGRLHGAKIVGEDGIKVTVDSNIEHPKVTFEANFDFQYQEIELDNLSYEPGVYYTEDNGVYTLDDSENFDLNKTYYKKSGIDITNAVLNNYYSNPTENGKIEAGDSLRAAFNKVENNMTYIEVIKAPSEAVALWEEFDEWYNGLSFGDISENWGRMVDIGNKNANTAQELMLEYSLFTYAGNNVYEIVVRPAITGHYYIKYTEYYNHYLEEHPDFAAIAEDGRPEDETIIHHFDDIAETTLDNDKKFNYIVSEVDPYAIDRAAFWSTYNTWYDGLTWGPAGFIYGSGRTVSDHEMVLVKTGSTPPYTYGNVYLIQGSNTYREIVPENYTDGTETTEYYAPFASVQQNYVSNLSGINQVFYTEGPNVPVKTTSTITIDNIMEHLYPIGGLYTTSTPGSLDPETGYYALTNMPGEWELIHKGFKYIDFDAYRGDVHDRNFNFTWADSNTQDYVIQGPDDTNNYGDRWFKIIRHRNSIKGSLYWCNKVAYGDTALAIGSMLFEELGLDVDQYGDQVNYVIGQSDDLNATFLCKVFKRNNQAGIPKLYIMLYDTVWKGEHLTTTNVPCYLSFDILITPDQMLDEACDEFIWKRVS